MRALRMTALALLAAACGEESGGLTAQLVIDERGISRRALRTHALEAEIGALEIAALDVSGATLAVTRLSITPSGDELQLDRAGGTWTLTGVPVGDDRIVRASAYLNDTGLPPSLAGRLGFQGEKAGISVRGDQITDAGTITLTPVPGIRIPRLDDTPPAAPGPLTVTPFPGGGTFDIQWARPNDADVAGYLVAITASATVSPPAPTASQFGLMAGSALAPGVVVVAWITDPALTETTAAVIGPSLHRVFVYAYDSELNGTPRNFSAAAVAQADPGDRDPPSPIGTLRVMASGGDGVLVSFFGPSEDTSSGGPPDRYEVRTSTSRAALEDPARFFALARRDPPNVVAPGTMGMFQLPFAAIGEDGTRPFFVAMRAIDAAGNAGPIAVAEYVPSAVPAPVITAVDPEIGVAGRPISIEGRLFGSATGEVYLLVTTSTSMRRIDLTITSWSTTQVNATLPANAMSGTLVVSRFLDHVMAVAELPVLAPLDPPPDPVLPPFEIASAPLDSGGVVHAVYEIVDNGLIEHGVRRIFGVVQSLMRLAPFLGEEATAVSADYAPGYDRFVFAAATPTVITAALVSTATVPAQLRRTVATVANANGVGLALIGSSTTARMPALLAFSQGNRVYSATVADVATGVFTRFPIVDTSTLPLSGAKLLYTGSSTLADATFLAYRVGTGTTARLALWSQTGARPDGFTEDAPGMGPPIAERFVMLDVPGEGLVIAYEHRREDGVVSVRLIEQSAFGMGPGWSPYPRETTDRRLHDAGLVLRGGRVWISLATVTASGGGTQLHYAEADPRAILANGFGTTRGVRLDIALAGAEMEARLGGKPRAVAGPPLIWNGPDGNGATYVRR